MATELVFDVLDHAALEEALIDLDGWEANGVAIQKAFNFSSFPAAIAFVNRVAEVAERLNHHPDIIINFRKVTVRYWTHKKNATTKANIVAAAEVDKVMIG
jgi:4a-hydroxytetrahydrobiopterin dehydratase